MKQLILPYGADKATILNALKLAEMDTGCESSIDIVTGMLIFTQRKLTKQDDIKH